MENKRILISLFFILFSTFLIAQNTNYQRFLIKKEELGLNGSKLKIDGFYYVKHIRLKSENDTIKFILPTFLYGNGSVAKTDYIGNGTRIYKKRVRGKKCFLDSNGKKDFKKIVSLVKCLSPSFVFKETYSFYSVKNNVIKMQWFYNNRLIESKGVVLNDSTFMITKTINYSLKKTSNIKLLYMFEKTKKPRMPDMKIKSFTK